NAFPPLIAKEQFERAQRILVRLHSNEEMLVKLRQLLQEKGTLSGRLINATDEMPSRGCYRNRFGSLPTAYRLVGFVPHDYPYNDARKNLAQRIRPNLMDRIREAAATVRTVHSKSPILIINEEFSALLFTAICRKEHQNPYWLVTRQTSRSPDITIV